MPSPSFPRALRALPAHLLAIAAQGDPAVQTAAVAGIRAYQMHPFRRPPSPAEEVWAGEGGARLLFLPAKAEARGAILLVPSLINGGEILDLLPDRSFARWLAAAGFDVYRLDWGVGALDLSGVIEAQLLPALAFAARQKKVHGIGHCMGGTLLTAAACLAQQHLHSLTLLASPWDFHAGDRQLARIVQENAAAAAQIASARGVLPADWLQQGFAQLAGDRLAAKFAAFAQLEQESARAELFVAVEDWLNEGRDLPARVATEIFGDWYGRNLPELGEWDVGSVRVAPRSLQLPSLHVVPQADRLVPRESALALAATMQGSVTLAPPVGHLGMISGGRAVDEVWRKILDWLPV